ncbi:hypothetical protein TNIN_94751 [Trichonephila inaurata madagascariensis]|uniref:Uncharacterized protein n=1 Tax=Trichonephila inaurata madagascariensis TaxID=2747483 RepID=A0A8X6YG65_9ARAC|nr:hypothetical protein TNIN_94751 [Trichonephila inaurata madagascariensis]
MNCIYCAILLIVLITLLSVNNVETFVRPFSMFGGFPFPFFFNPFEIFKAFPAMSLEWHRGRNVCVDQRIYPMGDVPTFPVDNVSESCRGDNYKFFCISTVMREGRLHQKINFYHCCPGFVRPANGGVGCVPGKLKFLWRILSGNYQKRFKKSYWKANISKAVY